jgi:hypothetical protein
MTQRQKILEQLKTIIDDIPEIAHIEVNKVGLPDLDIVAFPAVFIFGGSQARSNRATLVGQKVWDWEVFLSFWSKDEDMEGLYQKIYDKISSDPTLNRLAIDCDLDGVPDVNIVDADRAMVSMVLSFNVIYRHNFGAA